MWGEFHALGFQADGAGPAGQAVPHSAIGLFVVVDEGVVIENFDFIEVLEVCSLPRGLQDTGHRVFEVFRRQARAVREFHAFSQMELRALGGHLHPLRGEPGLFSARSGLGVKKGVVAPTPDHRADEVRDAVRVHRRWFARQGDGDGALRMRRQGRAHRQNGEDGQDYEKLPHGLSSFSRTGYQNLLR